MLSLKNVNFFVKNISAETTYGSIVLPAETRLSNTRMGPRRLNRGTLFDSVYIMQFFCVEVLGHCPDPVFGFCHTDPHIAPVSAIFWTFAHFFVSVMLQLPMLVALALVLSALAFRRFSAESFTHTDNPSQAR